MVRKAGSGRKRIPMAVIQNPTHLNVTFSKRRGSVFKKADQLSTLCEAEVGLIIFSPAGKAFSYGSPDLETLTNRIMSGGGGYGGPPGGSVVDMLNQTLNKIQQMAENETRKREEMDARRRVEEEGGGGGWWRREEGPETEAELLILKEAMEGLKLLVAEEAERVTLAEAAAAMTRLPFFIGGGSASDGAGPSSGAPNMYGGVGSSGFGYGRQQGPF